MPRTQVLLTTLLSVLLMRIPAAAGQCSSDECYAIPCASEGGSCTGCTVCPENTECRDGVCRQDVEGDICSWACRSIDAATGSNTLFCNYSRCAPLPAAGEPCIYNAHPCMPGLYCTATDSSPVGVCKPNPALGEPCSCDDASVCPEDTYCSGTPDGDPVGVCTTLPSAGAPCHKRTCLAPYVCEFNSSDESDLGECMEVPAVAGKPCSTVYGCAGGSLYCAAADGEGEGEAAGSELFTGTCAPLPGLEDNCSLALGCAEGLVCIALNGEDDPDNITCKRMVGMKGDYCDEVKAFCNDTLACLSNECADKIKVGGEGYPSSFCFNGTCGLAMSIKEGSPCYPREKVDGINISSVYATVQCMDGLGCVPDEGSVSNYSCVRIETRAEDRIKCDYGEINVCPKDSFCTCNDRDGVTQCIPYMPSSRWLLERYTTIVSAKNATDAVHEAYIDVVSRFLKHKVYYRCGPWEKDFFGKVKTSAAAAALVPSGLLPVLLGLLGFVYLCMDLVF